MTGFEDLKGLSEAELYKALTDLSNAQINKFGFIGAGQQMKDLAKGLRDKILTKEDIVGSEDKDGMIEDFAEDVKDDGITPEMINKILTDKFGVGKKYVIDEKTKQGKYVDDSEPQDWEGYLRKPEVEVKTKVKSDFTGLSDEEIMVKVKKTLDAMALEHPQMKKTIDDAIELKEKLEREKRELEKLKGKEDDFFDGLTKDDFFQILSDLVKAIEKNDEIVDDFVKDPNLSQYKGNKDKVFMGIQQFIYDCINKKGE